MAVVAVHAVYLASCADRELCRGCCLGLLYAHRIGWAGPSGKQVNSVGLPLIVVTVQTLWTGNCLRGGRYMAVFKTPMSCVVLTGRGAGVFR